MSDKESSAFKLPVTAGNEIVISGIAGRFPESDNLNELRDNLMAKRDMVTQDERRWRMDHPRVPKRTGKISNLEKFDAVFFGVHPKQAHAMDPMGRMLLEHAYEAIVDAGVNPKQLRGTKTGVFVGTCFSESEKAWLYSEQDSGFGITGCSRALYANRISYSLGLVGPSFALDTACSSSLAAFEQAYRSISEGCCDAAIVGGSNLCLEPYVAMQFFNLGALSPDGRCKTWDQSADGYVRSEAVCVAFLQKAKDAKRIYATVVHSKMNCDGYKEEGITFPSRHMQSALLTDLYKECGISPSSVVYVEAHGTGTKVGDPEEIAAIDKVLGQSRSQNSPLLIGSVKSNLGHAEPASGLISIAKVVLAMESGVIPPNLHFKTCKKDLKPILEGRLKVVTELTPWKGEHAAVNNFGFGGANVHALLRINSKEKVNNGAPNDGLPRLAVVSGRTEDAVDKMLKDLESKPVDVEHLALLYNVQSDEINGHLYRGYALLPSYGITKSPTREINSISGVKRPVWFVFSGMGSQWPGMGKALLGIPVFAEAIKKCDSVLKPCGIDIFHVITDNDPSVFDNILNCFIGIATVQIGLVDILKSLGIEPNHIIGHSVGELGCAYADGCLTAEQMIMSAYFRGLVSTQSKFISGSMAAVGLGYKEIKKMCPTDIEIACHNSSSSSTISGPTESMKKFVAELKAKDIFAKEVPCGNIPYHSSYIAAAGPKLLEKLRKIIPVPKLRSSKWVCTSLEMDQWNTELARYSSAEYHTNNLVSSVLFEETSTLIPNDAITIEIAPHGLLQAILKRSLSTSVTNIALAQRGDKDNLEVFLKAVGKMFNVGLHPQLDKLYPPVEFPVSRGTPMISPMIKWEHKDDWFVSYFKDEQKLGSGERIVKINIKNPDYETIAGHVLDGRNLLPAMSYLTLIWETFGTMKGKHYSELPVIFEDIKFLRATTFPKEGEVELTLMIHKGTGKFEVSEGGTAVVTGNVRSTSHPEAVDRKWTLNSNESNNEECMTSRDVYKEFKLRGYQYSGKFRSITRASEDGSKAHIAWNNDWIAYMDNVLQIVLLGIDSRELFVPTAIKKIVIDPNLHYERIRCGEAKHEFEAFHNKLHNTVSSGGVQIFGIQARSIARRKFTNEPVLEEHKFVPFMDEAEMSLRDIARVVTNVGMENYMGVKVKTIELINGANEESFDVDNLLSPWISESLGDMPLIQADVNILLAETSVEFDTLPASISIIDIEKASKDANAMLIVGHRLLAPEQTAHLNLVLHELKPGGFILTRENDVTNIENVARAQRFHVILKKKFGKEIFALLRKKQQTRTEISIVNVHNDNFDWIESMRKNMSEKLKKEKTNETRIVFVGQGYFDNGLLGFINCLRREPGGEIVRGILIQDQIAPAFSLDNPLYSQQLEKDLAISILRENGVWGSYRHLLLPPFEARPVYHSFLKQNIPGDLSSFTWTEGPLQPTCSSKNLAKIAYASINFRDVMFATGKLSLTSSTMGSKQNQESALGMEYTGIDSLGKRIMGMIDGRAIANICVADPELSWEIPANWSLEDAATVPCVYATCCYALYLKGNMKKGDKVLIHAGTGGIGQAAINLALAEGCDVYTTVGTPEKRQFIRNTFPKIRDDHIGNSRDTSFESMIREKTNGYGVDLVLNSLSEEKLIASVNCLAWGGRFLEIGKFDLTANNPLGMECFLREVSFHGIMLDHIFIASEQKKLETKVLVDKYIKNGAIKPLVRTVFSKDNIEAAFRYMAAGKHIGKVMIQIQEENPSTSVITAVPQYYCLENRSYVILGGLGGFGLELCDWLVRRGAKNLVLTSRAGLKNGYQRKRVNLWKSYGVKVIIVDKKDASVYEDCKFIIETATKLAPVDGVFNLAVILKDAIWENQTLESFEESFKPKAWTTKNLDSITRIMCSELRYFVVFSSVSCGRGNAGQSSYGMSNSVMERICEKRATEGLPALAVQWGAVGDVGLVADMQEDNKELIIGGTLQQNIISCLKELNDFMLQSSPIVSSMVVAENKADGSANVLNSVLNIMCLKDLKGINLHSTLSEVGMDSMMSVEIKQTLEREFDVFLSAQDIRNLTFAKLQDMAGAKHSDGKSQKDAEVKTQLDKFAGMKMLVRFINNASVSHDAYLKLPTKKETKDMEVFAIPGIEGFATNFSELSPKLKVSVTCLQLGITNNIHESIEDMADYLFTHVFNKCKEHRKFTLLGYSFGSLIAIELARRLEAQGLRGRIFLIDGAPGMIKAIITRDISWINSEDLENKCLLMMLHIVAPQQILKLSVDLEKCKSWNEKVEAFIKSCPASKLGLNYENQKDYCTSIYKRILAAINYNVSQLKPIEAPITLLKPSIKSLQTELEDYGLSRVTNNQVEVHYVSGDHVTILESDEIARIINEII